MSIVEKAPELEAIKRQMAPKPAPLQYDGSPVIFTHMLGNQHDGSQLKEPVASKVSPMQHTFDTQDNLAPAPQVSPPRAPPPEHSNEYLDAKAAHARKLAAKLKSMGAADEAAELEQMALALERKKR